MHDEPSYGSRAVSKDGELGSSWSMVLKDINFDRFDPRTWPWGWVFDLYVFAEQYQVACLQQTTFDTILAPLLSTAHKPDQQPSADTIARAVHEVSAASPLAELLAVMYVHGLEEGDAIAAVDQQSTISFPVTFQTAVLKRLRRKIETMQCHMCHELARWGRRSHVVFGEY